MNYLASPPLVVAYAIAGTVNIDLTTRFRWARTATASRCICETSGRATRKSATQIAATVGPEMFAQNYADVFKPATARWNAIAAPTASLRLG